MLENGPEQPARERSDVELSPRPPLEIIVLVAPVHDCRSPVTIEPGGKRIDPRSLRWIMNPYDAIALEQALQLRDRIPRTRVSVTCLAAPGAENVARECLAVGADEVVQVCDVAPEVCDPYATAVILAATIRNVDFDLLLCGSRRSDLEHGQVGPILAETMKLPLVSAACNLRPTADRVVVQKRVPGHLVRLSCPLPAVVTIESGPALRYPTYPDRRRAAKHPIRIFSTDTIGIPGDTIGAVARTTVERFTPPKPRRRSAAGAHSSSLSTAARIRKLIGGDALDRTDQATWECKDRESVENVVQHMLREKIVIL